MDIRITEKELIIDLDTAREVFCELTTCKDCVYNNDSSGYINVSDSLKKAEEFIMTIQKAFYDWPTTQDVIDEADDEMRASGDV